MNFMKPALRFTRRGPMVFCAAEQGGPSGSAANADAAAAAKTAAPAAATDGVVDYKAKLLALLGLDDTADDAAIDAKIAEWTDKMAKLPELETSAGNSATALEAANQELERIRGEYQVLFDQDQAAQKAKQEAEVDAIMEQFADRLTDDKAKARIRSILVSDREAGMEILNGLKKPETAAPAEGAGSGTPPSPQHDPNAAADAAMTQEEKITQQNALIKEIQKEGKFTDYESARAEARRRKPELFS